MPAAGYTAISVKQELLPVIKEFQILAIAKTGRLLNQTQSIALAIELATKELEK